MTTLGYSLIISFVVLVIVEYMLSALWVPVYFRSGIVLYKRTVLLKKSSNMDELRVEPMKSQLSGCIRPNFSFKRLNQNELAFREILFQVVILNYLPLMHGLISIDSTGTRLTIAGRLNWFWLTFIGFLTIMVTTNAYKGNYFPVNDIIVLGFLSLGLVYYLQFDAYNLISNEVNKQVEKIKSYA